MSPQNFCMINRGHWPKLFVDTLPHTLCARNVDQICGSYGEEQNNRLWSCVPATTATCTLTTTTLSVVAQRWTEPPVPN
jgi:hypothetical protein